MNFELDSYVDAQKDFPSKEIQLETLDNTYYHFKTDVFKGLISYSTSPNFGANVVTISAERARQVISMNKRGSKPEILDDKKDEEKPAHSDYENVVGQDSLTRFDSQKKRTGSKSKKNNNKPQGAKRAAGQSENKAANENRIPRLVKKNDQNKKNDA